MKRWAIVEGGGLEGGCDAIDKAKIGDPGSHPPSDCPCGGPRTEANMSGEELYYAANHGNTEDVRRLLAQKAPLEYGKVRHRPYRKSTTHRPAHAGALCVAKGAAERA